MNKYLELKQRQQKEVNDFPMFFAFSNEQFKEGMKKLGLKESDTKKIYKLGNTGGYYRRTDSKALRDMFNRHDEELKKAMKEDSFVIEMFVYELANHEYGYTYDLEPTLDSLGITFDDIKKDSRLKSLLDESVNKYLEGYEG